MELRYDSLVIPDKRISPALVCSSLLLSKPIRKPHRILSYAPITPLSGLFFAAICFAIIALSLSFASICSLREKFIKLIPDKIEFPELIQEPNLLLPDENFSEINQNPNIEVQNPNQIIESLKQSRARG